MSRENLIQALDAYAQRWPQESETALRFADFVERNRDCFQRSLAEGHVTGSAWIVSQDGKRTLLTHHRKLGAWFQLGGHADGVERPVEVALAEAVEESGITDFQLLSEEIFDIDIHLIPARKSDPAHYHYDVRYLLRPVASEEYTVSEESLDLNWVEIENIQDFTTEDSMLRMASKWTAIKSDF